MHDGVGVRWTNFFGNAPLPYREYILSCILILTPFNNIHVQMNDCQSKDEEQVHIHTNNNKSVRCTCVQEQVHIECTIIV